MIYLIDSNTFMTAARTFYSFDYGSKFWDFIKEQAKNNALASIDKVFEEINKGNDVLKDWANEEFSNYFLTTKEESIFQKYAELVRFAENQGNHYTRNAIDEFMKEDNADPWLIAYSLAKNKNYTIVTFEKANENRKNKIPIPNVCNYYKIKYCDLYEMLRNLNFRL
ncbi:hypothetical protein PW5551_03650 [Petrotoga sp. 9PW.55.5.1]|uniref:DUF4411 family protein n=1 Tax=Petrotoga sp. 9PW.55.5.1 TaxID=1308979 RepID=UPI000DC52377|nr:DUF4411 family protein [Petrotoga sp. 9PW.55.5.1]RAO99578.1 hypothetical protein PW5551_03650 [Petrotoga sp. 9PW.55.5.1]